MRTYISLILLLISTNVYAVTAGTVIFSQGKTFSTSLNGETRVLAKGAPIENGDTIKTGADAIMQLKMIDGAKFALQPNTTFKVDEYLYNGSEDGTERAFFSLVKGALRTVTGAIGNKNKKNYLANTPTATIGVRGTEYALKFDGVTLVTVGDGAITLCNKNANCLDLNLGQSAIVLDKDATPKLTDKTVVQEDKAKKDLAASFIVENKENDFKPNDDSQSETLVVVPVVVPVEVGVVVPAVVPVVVPPLLPANNIPLASGIGNLNIFLQSSGANPNAGFTGANINAGLTGANMVFDANGVLTSYRDTVSTNVGADIGANAENYGDGIIAWGRWSSGARQTGSVPIPIDTFTYTAALSSSATPAAVLSTLSGIYTAFGSSSPIKVNVDGAIGEVGSPNTVTGSLNVNFVAGTVVYNITIPLLSDTFTMAGTSNFVNNSPTGGDSRFLGLANNSGTITSTGPSCDAGCIGVVPNSNNGMAGTIVGLNGERAGVIYGFEIVSGSDAVSGSVVFKR